MEQIQKQSIEIVAVLQDKDKRIVLLHEIKDRGIITEKEVNLIKLRLNRGVYNEEDINIIDGVLISEQQAEKGLTWLKNKGWTPKGKERINNPFGYMEEQAIKTFKEFRLKGFYTMGQQFKHYIPVYELIGENGSFSYFVMGGEVKYY